MPGVYERSSYLNKPIYKRVNRFSPELIIIPFLLEKPLTLSCH